MAAVRSELHETLLDESIPVGSEKLLRILKDLPADGIQELIDKALDLSDQAEPAPSCCPYCGSTSLIRYGKKHGKQRFLCKAEDCGHTFVSTRNTVMYWSHQPTAVWRKVIADTLEGVSLKKTCAKVNATVWAEHKPLSHQTAFNMRHKILMALEDIEAMGTLQEHASEVQNSTSEAQIPSSVTPDTPSATPDTSSATQPAPAEVVELDETFILDGRKGKRLPADLGREPRKHGAKASAPGISSEYLCVCAGVNRNTGTALALCVNRAKPSLAELKSVFNGTMARGTLVLTDGLRGYEALCVENGCNHRNVNAVSHADTALYNINRVNNFHSFIKERIRHYRGVASKYLNRYNALFCAAYKPTWDTIDSISTQLLSISSYSYSNTIYEVRMSDLLCI